MTTRQRLSALTLTLGVLAVAFAAAAVVQTYVAIWTMSGQWGATAFASGCIAFLCGAAAGLVAS